MIMIFIPALMAIVAWIIFHFIYNYRNLIRQSDFFADSCCEVFSVISDSGHYDENVISFLENMVKSIDDREIRRLVHMDMSASVDYRHNICPEINMIKSIIFDKGKDVIDQFLMYKLIEYLALSIIYRAPLECRVWHKKLAENSNNYDGYIYILYIINQHIKK